MAELGEYEGQPVLAPGMVSTAREVAVALSVSERTVKRWIRQGMPRTPEGYYEISAIAQWREQRLDRQRGACGKNAGDADERLREAKARLAELELEERIGRYILREEYEKDLADRIVVLKRRLLALVHELPPQLEGLEPRQMKSVIKTRIEEMIIEYSGQAAHGPGARKG